MTMILGLFYYVAFLVVAKFLPGCNFSNADFNIWMLLPAVGLVVGLFDGCVSFLRMRSFSALIIAPFIHVVIMIIAWYVAKLIPWTRAVDGSPTENGLMLTAAVIGAVLSGVLSK